jgi:hypothetical protein
MSDTTPDGTPDGASEPAKIDFEKAEFAEPSGEHVQCGICQRSITTEYWQCLGKILCDTCREGVRRSSEDAASGASFGKALLLGGGVAFGCGIGYAIFVGLTQIQFALVTIGIGWMVGRSIQRITRGFGGQKHQVLAVALTYFASTMGYAPAIYKAITNSAQNSEHDAETSTATPAPAAPGTTAPTETPRSPERADPPASPSSGGGGPSLVIALVFLVGLMLAAPFLELSGGFSGIIGLLIIFFGLQTAWRVSRGVQANITGPHKVAASGGS